MNCNSVLEHFDVCNVTVIMIYRLEKYELQIIMCVYRIRHNVQCNVHVILSAQPTTIGSTYINRWYKTTCDKCKQNTVMLDLRRSISNARTFIKTFVFPSRIKIYYTRVLLYLVCIHVYYILTRPYILYIHNSNRQ